MYGSFEILIAFGITPAANLQIEIWRFVTYGFVHVNAFHAVSNAIVYWMVGKSVEAKRGAVRVAGVTLLGLVTGGVVAVLFAGPALVGLSTAVFALLGYEFLGSSIRATLIEPRKDWWRLLKELGVIAILVVGLSLVSASAIAHISGLIAGVLAGRPWHHEPRRPKP
ncbi:MAG: rhomboid family intramembrane serine protease [Actinomycetota bacterium]|nr:rhomboid family intramembrane serine protease [Actinomycetota bacterium]